MSKLGYLAIVLALVAGGYYLYNHYEIRGLDHLRLQPRGVAEEPWDSFPAPLAARPAAGGTSGGSPAKPSRTWVRIATFDFGPMDSEKMAQRPVIGGVVRVIRDFDIVAVQGLRAPNQAILVDLVDQVNADGRHYDFATSPEVGRRPVDQFGAFLYDRDTIQIDPSTVCTVNDADNRFGCPPLVASFAVRGPPPSQAFTFTLINALVSPDRLSEERDLLDDTFRAVRDDGRGEDDVILLGNLGVDHQHLGPLRSIPNLMPATPPLPTTTRGTMAVDHILLDRVATIEFTGRADVVDLMRQLDLSADEALEVSAHLPVWAEFSIYEGGQPLQLAIGSTSDPR